ncbi:peptidase C14, caspase domain-containing protein [Mycena rosella]|uniref:Peptidase C14, caspase domain-containing protein n=1 Tax=Mycena rosella TaxID=1033263 RepID=A0AAD7GXU1_MYCRO|nr:peptidase C14, caspase domain-containing protein [Mycena rosella]
MPPMNQQNYGPQFQGANQQMQQPFFQYSQCSGKKKALCIGINYVGQDAELHGCVNDAGNIKKFLIEKYGYQEQDIVMLTDGRPNGPPQDPRQIPARQMPTKANIIDAMRWLVNGAAPNDSLFFHYSGHGGQTKDLDGDEGDGMDEVIYPVDFQTNSHIVDDEMHRIMVQPLPPGCRLTSIFDSCHSGSALDLPYIYSTEGKVKEPNLAAEAGAGLKTAFSSYAKGDMGGVFKSAMGLVKTATGGGQKAEQYARATRTSPADVISWSGCKDSQTSADANEAGRATGAMSYAFITALQQQPQQSYQQLLNSLRDILRAKYSQKPQLSSSHPMDTNIMFIC